MHGYASENFFRGPKVYFAFGIVAIGAASVIRALAVLPPLVCALFVNVPDQWSLFERSGSLTAAIGLLLASRQYLKPGNLEVAVLNRAKSANSNLVELVEETRCHKLGLAVSAFGSIVMGWGSYLRWWTFSYFLVWAAIATYDAWRDLARLRGSGLPGST